MHTFVKPFFFFFIFMRNPFCIEGAWVAQVQHFWRYWREAGDAESPWLSPLLLGGDLQPTRGVPMPIFRPTGHQPHCHRLVDSVCACKGWAGPASPHGAAPGLGICAPKGPGRFVPGAPQVTPGPIWRLAICCCTWDRCNWAWPLVPNELLRNGLLQSG